MKIKQTPAERVQQAARNEDLSQKRRWITGWLSHREARGKTTRLDAVFAEATVTNTEPWRFPVVLGEKEEPSKKMEDRPGKEEREVLQG